VGVEWIYKRYDDVFAQAFQEHVLIFRLHQLDVKGEVSLKYKVPVLVRGGRVWR
jgi:hypothetical protein